MKLAQIGALAAALSLPIVGNEGRVNRAHQGHQDYTLHYLSPKDSGKEINVVVGDEIVFQTNPYGVVPAYQDGEIKIKAIGDRTLEIISQDGHAPAVSRSSTNGEGKFVSSIFGIAREKGTSTVTIKFFDTDKKETESTTYKVVVE